MAKLLNDERGLALLVAILATTLMLALGVALVMTATTETLISASFHQARAALYAAEAVAERGLADLDAAPDWHAVIDGSVRSAFVDGPPAGDRSLADGSRIDLEQIVALADDVSSERLRGVNPPRWTAFAHGFLRDLNRGGAAIESDFYGVVLVAADPDGDELMWLRAEAFGPRGAHKVVELTARRTPQARSEPVQAAENAADVSLTGLHVISWREAR